MANSLLGVNAVDFTGIHVPAVPTQKSRTRTPSARVEDDGDTYSGAGSDGECRDESADEPSDQANVSDSSSADFDLPQTPF